MKLGLLILGFMLLCALGLALTVPGARCVKWEDRGGAAPGATYSVCVKREKFTGY